MKKSLNTQKVVESITSAYNFVAEPVGTTLGPGGRNVILRDAASRPILTKDGVTVSSNLHAETEEQELLVSIIKEAGDKTNREAGDGTTSATVLSEKVYAEGIKMVAAGHRPVDVQRQILVGTRKVLNELDSRALKSEDWTDKLDTLKKIANISMNGDTEIASLVAEAVDAVGVTGAIAADASKNGMNSWSQRKGLKINRGWVSPGFKRDPNATKLVLENPYILVTSYTMEAPRQLAALEKVLMTLSQQNRPLLIIPSGNGARFVETFIASVANGNISGASILPPYYGNVRREFFLDLAALTGATVIDKDQGDELEAVSLEHLGQAESVEITKDSTTIIGGKGKTEVLAQRVETLKQLLQETNGPDLDKVKERLTNLSSGLATIELAHFSDLELEEKKHRVEDAAHACKAALEEGYIPGGGTGLLKAAMDVLDSKTPGELILLNACKQLVAQIANNAGNSGEVAISKVVEWKPEDKELAINHLTGQVVSALEAGIIDPVKVVKASLMNGTSIAATLLTTGAIVSDIPEPKHPFLEAY